MMRQGLSVSASDLSLMSGNTIVVKYKIRDSYFIYTIQKKFEMEERERERERFVTFYLNGFVYSKRFYHFVKRQQPARRLQFCRTRMFIYLHAVTLQRCAFFLILFFFQFLFKSALRVRHGPVEAQRLK